MTDYEFKKMDLANAEHIANTWTYPKPYDFYDMANDPEDYQEFVTPEQWPELVCQVVE